MIDELPTRAAMTVAAALLLATGLSVLDLSNRDAVREAAADLADHVAAVIDDVSSRDVEVRLSGGDGVFGLPDAVAGSRYHVEVRARVVLVVTPSFTATAPLRAPVHPFEPSSFPADPEELAGLDAGRVVAGPGAALVVERTWRWVASEPTYATFVYLPR